MIAGNIVVAQYQQRLVKAVVKVEIIAWIIFGVRKYLIQKQQDQSN